MTRFVFDLPGARITDYSSHGVNAVALARGRGESHTWLLSFEAGGEIGAHLAGFDQLFFVLSGTAWVDVDGAHHVIDQGEGVTIAMGQTHAKGSLNGARVLMVQVGALEYPVDE